MYKPKKIIIILGDYKMDYNHEQRLKLFDNSSDFWSKVMRFIQYNYAEKERMTHKYSNLNFIYDDSFDSDMNLQDATFSHLATGDSGKLFNKAILDYSDTINNANKHIALSFKLCLVFHIASELENPEITHVVWEFKFIQDTKLMMYGRSKKVLVLPSSSTSLSHRALIDIGLEVPQRNYSDELDKLKALLNNLFEDEKNI